MRRLLTLWVALLALPAAAGTISLRWNPVAGAQGYVVGYGTSAGTYDHLVDVGPTTITRLNGLDDCFDYHIAVRAYDAWGRQSGWSSPLVGWTRPTIITNPTPTALLHSGTGLNVLRGASIRPGARLVLLDAPGESIEVEAVVVGSCDQAEIAVVSNGPPPTEPQTFTARLINPDNVRSLPFPLRLLPARPKDAWSVVQADSAQAGLEPAKAIDGNPATFWHTRFAGDTAALPHQIEIDLGEPVTVEAVGYLPRQDNSTNGTIGQYEFAVQEAGGPWSTIASGTLSGATEDDSQRIVRVSSVRADRVRLRALSEVHGAPWTSAAEIDVWGGSANLPPLATIVTPAGKPEVVSGSSLTFSGSGVDPEGQELTFHWILPGCATPQQAMGPTTEAIRFECMPGAYSVTLEVCDPIGACNTDSLALTVFGNGCEDIDPSSWSVVSTDSEERTAMDGRAVRAIDGNPATLWHTRWSGGATPPPHEIVLDLAEDYLLCGLGYLPRQDSSTNGTIREFDLAVSSDGTSWQQVTEGVLVDNAGDRSLRSLLLPGVPARFVKLRALGEVNDGPWTSVAELTLRGSPHSDPPTATIDEPARSITIAAGEVVHFAGTVTDPGSGMLTYRWTFPSCAVAQATDVEDPGAVTFQCGHGSYMSTLEACNSSGLCTIAYRTVSVLGSDCVRLPKDAWSVVAVDSEAGPAWSAERAIDDDPATFWHTAWNESPDLAPQHEVEISLGEEHVVCGLGYLPRQDGGVNGMIRRYHLSLGREVESAFTWTNASNGSLVVDPATLEERLVPFTAHVASRFRLRAVRELNGGPWASAAELAIFVRGDNQAPVGSIRRPVADPVRHVGDSVFFRAAAEDPENDLPLRYRWTFPSCAVPSQSEQSTPEMVHFDCPPGDYAVTVEMCDRLGACRTDARRVTVLAPGCSSLPQDRWQIQFVDSQETLHYDGRARNAIDGNPGTIWHTSWTPAAPPPHELQIDLGGAQDVCSFRYLPRQDDSPNGMIGRYELSVSLDGVSWTGVSNGRLVINPGDRSERSVNIPSTPARYLRLRALDEVGGRPWSSAAEIRIFAD